MTNDPLRLPCPTCSGTRSTTTGDRHANTNMDVCATCEDRGTIPARTGEAPEASFGFVNRNTKATDGNDFPTTGMSFPKIENGPRTDAAARVADLVLHTALAERGRAEPNRPAREGADA